LKKRVREQRDGALRRNPVLHAPNFLDHPFHDVRE
jgi:hypothetical protein